MKHAENQRKPKEKDSITMKTNEDNNEHQRNTYDTRKTNEQIMNTNENKCNIMTPKEKPRQHIR